MDQLFISVILFFTIFVSSFCGTVLGFGSAVIAISMGAQLVSLDRLVPIIVILSFIQFSKISYQNYQSVSWKIILKSILPKMGLGLAVGFYLKASFKVDFLLIVLGVGVIFFALSNLFFKKNMEKSPNKLVNFVLTFTGGIFHGLFAAGGPLIVNYVGNLTSDKETFRATLAMVWVVLNLILLLQFSIGGVIDKQMGMSIFYLLPAIWLGGFAGEKLLPKINPSWFFKFVHSTLLIIGVSLLFKV